MGHPANQYVQLLPGFACPVPAERLAQPHDDIRPADLSAPGAEAFADDPLRQIPVDGPPFRFLWDDHAQPGMLPAARPDLDLEKLAENGAPETKNGRKLVRLQQAIRSWKRINGRRSKRPASHVPWHAEP